MSERHYGYNYDGEPVFSRIKSDAPRPDTEKLDRDFFLFVMGPYTAFDATYVYDDADRLETRFADDPLFDPDEHVTDDGRGDYEAALRDLCAQLRSEFGVRAFLATDIDIPTVQEADGTAPGMPVPEQSVAFAAVSDAVMFVFTEGGLTAGTGCELGSILGRFNLGVNNPEPVRKPRERIRIFRSESFASATVEETTAAYGIDCLSFENADELVKDVRNFLTEVNRNSPEELTPVYNPFVD